MGHPLLDEFCRVPGVQNCQPHFFNRVQRELKATVQPLLDELDEKRVENATLKAQLAASEQKVARKAEKSAA